jgi:Zn-dependent M28 family amino/carboxypeptidase
MREIIFAPGIWNATMGLRIGAAALVFLFGCAHVPSATDSGTPTFSPDRFLGHIRTLSSNEFEGRAPASKGERLTVQYLENQYRSMGLEPGNPDGTYMQNVPLVGITPDKAMKFTLTGHGQTLQPKFEDDFVAWSKRVTATSSIDADLIFVGYGVKAPEYQWDDYKGVDVKGKMLVMLVNDPPVPDPSDSTKLDPNVFGGTAMTYYGRWTYKFEQAARMGAAGCILIHQTNRAGYPWDVVRNSWSGTQFDLATPDKNMGRLAIESWITSDFATQLFHLAGQDLDKLIQSAAQRNFKPVPLGIHAKLAIHNSLESIDSHNVVAKLSRL